MVWQLPSSFRVVLSLRGVVCLVQAFLTPQHLAISMEFASGGDMFEHVVRKGGLKESEARWFFQQLIVGVDYVHKMVRYGCTLDFPFDSKVLGGSYYRACGADGWPDGI